MGVMVNAFLSLELTLNEAPGDKTTSKLLAPTVTESIVALLTVKLFPPTLMIAEPEKVTSSAAKAKAGNIIRDSKINK